MELRVNGRVFALYNEVTVNLAYNSVASTFAFKVYYNPDSKADRETFKPFSFHSCTVTHEGALLLTGTVIYHQFMSAGDPPKSLVLVSGYSKTGVLERGRILNIPAGTKITKDTKVLPESALQVNNVSLLEIARQVTAYYGITVVLDAELQKDPLVTAPFTAALPDPKDTVKEYLDKLCKVKNVILSHTPRGELLLTRVKADKLEQDATQVADTVMGSIGFRPVERRPMTPAKVQVPRPTIFRFAPGVAKWTKMTATFDGQEMPRVVQAVGQNSGPQPYDDLAVNTYVSAAHKLFLRDQQNAGSTSDTISTARSILGATLSGAEVVIESEGWTLGGYLARPNRMVSVVNPEVGLHHEHRWFVRNVLLHDDNGVNKTATLSCVLPECFNSEKLVSAPW